MADDTFEAQRQNIVGRLTEIRDTYQKCVSDVSAEAANKGSEWSIVDLLRHTTGGYYFGMIKRLLEEDNPDMGGGAFDPEANWKRVTDSLLGDIDGTIRTATELTPEQQGRSGKRRGNTITVLDVLTLMADHYDEHLAQLRDEIRPREGLRQT
jgi:hypothetical protein